MDFRYVGPMKRKEALLFTSAALGCAFCQVGARAQAAAAPNAIPVAFVVGPTFNLIDVAGPWEAFSAVWETKVGHLPPPSGSDTFLDSAVTQPVFTPYLVSDTLDPVKAGNRLRMLPDHTYDTAPAPAIIVMPAQSGHTPTKLEWIRETARTADVVMSVCTGAYLFAATGLLDGKRATTHHDYYDDFAKTYPRVELVRGPRFVENGKLKTAGGLTSGINLAVHVVSEMRGEPRAEQLAHYLEFVPAERG